MTHPSLAWGNACFYDENKTIFFLLAAVMSGPLGSVDNSEIWDGWSEKAQQRVTGNKFSTRNIFLRHTDHLDMCLSSMFHHQPTVTVKSWNKTTLIVVCVLCHCFSLMWFGAVLQLSIRHCVLEEKASDQTPSLSSWKVRQQHASMCVRLLLCTITDTYTDNAHPPTECFLSLSGRHQWMPGAARLVPGRTVHQHLWQLPVWMSKRLCPQHRYKSLWRYSTHTCICMQPHRHMNTQVT